MVIAQLREEHIDHGSIGGLSDDDHSQYLLATGARAGASSQRQTFTNGLTTNTIRPTADTTTAFQVESTSGTTVLNVNTSQTRVSIGPSATTETLVVSAASSDAALRVNAPSGSNAAMYLSEASSTKLTAFWDGINSVTKFRSGAGVPLWIGSNNTQHIAIDAGGLVEIGGGVAPTAYLTLKASTTSNASLRIRSGPAPASPNDGDIWFDGGDLLIRIDGTTYTLDKTSA